MSLPSGYDRLANAARIIAPLLNRVVFSGPAIADLLRTDTTLEPRATIIGDTTIHLLSTASLDRLTADLPRLGFRRETLGTRTERWVSRDVHLEFVYVSDTEHDPMAAWLEYASLLTRVVRLGGQDEEGWDIRISGAPALLALRWATFRKGSVSPLDSEVLEDVIALVAGRSEIVHETGAAPPELRLFVSAEARRFLANDAAAAIIAHALPGAAQQPALARRVAERFRALGALT